MQTFVRRCHPSRGGCLGKGAIGRCGLPTGPGQANGAFCAREQFGPKCLTCPPFLCGWVGCQVPGKENSGSDRPRGRRCPPLLPGPSAGLLGCPADSVPWGANAAAPGADGAQTRLSGEITLSQTFGGNLRGEPASPPLSPKGWEPLAATPTRSQCGVHRAPVICGEGQPAKE